MTADERIMARVQRIIGRTYSTALIEARKDLVAARGLVAQGWTHSGAYKVKDSSKPTGCRYCAVGALIEGSNDLGVPQRLAVRLLAASVNDGKTLGPMAAIIGYNDAYARSKHDVLRRFDLTTAAIDAVLTRRGVDIA